MQSDEMTSHLLDYIRQKFEVPDDDPEFSPEINLFDYGYIDSFGSVEIYTHLEQKYGVTITPEQLMRFPLRSVDQMVRFVLESKEK